MDAYEEQVRLIEPDGTLRTHPNYKLDLGDDALRWIYRQLVVVRRLDTEGANLQRQGQLALWPPCLGQEAAQIGSAMAVQAEDFIFPSYRELGVAYVRGVDPVDVCRQWRGAALGGWDPHEHRMAPYAIPIATQALHAVGWALGAQWEGAREAAIVYFGDGATSEGDLSEALNVAAVHRVPMVFFCQNNQWAISVPLHRQAAAPLWRRGIGFGVPGVPVDGNDPLAVYAVTRTVMDRARDGGGPTLIEARTYRLGAHTTADDPTRYRSSGELDEWSSREPIGRYRTFLQRNGLWSEELERQTADAAEQAALRMRQHVETMPDPPLSHLVDQVYAQPPATLTRQFSQLLEFEGEDETSGTHPGGEPSGLLPTVPDPMPVPAVPVPAVPVPAVDEFPLTRQVGAPTSAAAPVTDTATPVSGDSAPSVPDPGLESSGRPRPSATPVARLGEVARRRAEALPVADDQDSHQVPPHRAYGPNPGSGPLGGPLNAPADPGPAVTDESQDAWRPYGHDLGDAAGPPSRSPVGPGPSVSGPSDPGALPALSGDGPVTSVPPENTETDSPGRIRLEPPPDLAALPSGPEGTTPRTSHLPGPGQSVSVAHPSDQRVVNPGAGPLAQRAGHGGPWRTSVIGHDQGPTSSPDDDHRPPHPSDPPGAPSWAPSEPAPVEVGWDDGFDPSTSDEPGAQWLGGPLPPPPDDPGRSGAVLPPGGSGRMALGQQVPSGPPPPDDPGRSGVVPPPGGPGQASPRQSFSSGPAGTPSPGSGHVPTPAYSTSQPAPETGVTPPFVPAAEDPPTWPEFSAPLTMPPVVRRATLEPEVAPAQPDQQEVRQENPEQDEGQQSERRRGFGWPVRADSGGKRLWRR